MRLRDHFCPGIDPNLCHSLSTFFKSVLNKGAIFAGSFLYQAIRLFLQHLSFLLAVNAIISRKSFLKAKLARRNSVWRNATQRREIVETGVHEYVTDSRKALSGMLPHDVEPGQEFNNSYELHCTECTDHCSMDSERQKGAGGGRVGLVGPALVTLRILQHHESCQVCLSLHFSCLFSTEM